MAQLYAPSRFFQVDGNGHVYAAAKLYFYQTGTTTLQTVYADSAATTPLSNPVVADSNGLFAAIYLSNANPYKAVLKSSADVTIWTTDPIVSTFPSAAFTPQGRLTLATETPVMTSNQTAATTIYYTPYIGNQLPIYDGSAFVPTVFGELTNLTAQSSSGSAGPAAVTTNSNYDLFVWNNAGVPTLTRGPAWTSDTARGTGAGTTQISRASGIWTNTVAITNGPAAGMGTYVGTVRSDGSSQINWIRGGTAAGGTAAVLGVWNAYNRRLASGAVSDSADTWSYAGGVWRAANSAVGMRMSFVDGLQEDFAEARYDAAGVASGGSAHTSVGLNTITAPATGAIRAFNGGAAATPMPGSHRAQLLGFNFMQAIELNVGVTATFYGDGGSVNTQTGLIYNVWT